MKFLAIQNFNLYQSANDNVFQNAMFSLGRMVNMYLFQMPSSTLKKGILEVTAIKFKEKAIIP